MAACGWAVTGRVASTPQVAGRQVVPGRQRLGSSRRDLLTPNVRLGDFNIHLYSTLKQAQKLPCWAHSSENLHGVSHVLSRCTFLSGQCYLDLLRRTALFIEISTSVSIPKEGEACPEPPQGQSWRRLAERASVSGSSEAPEAVATAGWSTALGGPGLHARAGLGRARFRALNSPRLPLLSRYNFSFPWFLYIFIPFKIILHVYLCRCLILSGRLFLVFIFIIQVCLGYTASCNCRLPVRLS